MATLDIVFPLISTLLYNNFGALRCGTYWRAVLKRGRDLFKVTAILQAFKILRRFSFSLQITINNYHYDVQFYVFESSYLL